MDVGRTQRFSWTILLSTAVGFLALAGCSPVQAPDNSQQPTATIAPTVSAPQGSAPPPVTPRQATSSGVVPTVDHEVLIDVDPNQYRDPNRPDGYFFMSPSKNLSCGFVTTVEGQLTGCQAWVRVANLPKCDAPQSNSSPAIDFQKGKAAAGYCLSQGVFSAETKVLKYGDQITVGGVTCTSRPTGMTCTDKQSGRGFKASREGFLPIG